MSGWRTAARSPSTVASKAPALCRRQPAGAAADAAATAPSGTVNHVTAAGGIPSPFPTSVTGYPAHRSPSATWRPSRPGPTITTEKIAAMGRAYPATPLHSAR